MLKIIQLEERIVLDAAAMIDVVDYSQQAEAIQSTDTLEAPPVVETTNNTEVTADVLALLDEPSSGQTQLILVSNALSNYQTLADDLRNSGAEVLVYNADTDSVADVVAMVSDLAEKNGEDFSSLMLLSHGSEGQFNLGNETITSDNVAEYSAQLEQLNDALVDGGQLIIYGCNVLGDGGTGQSLIDQLAELTNTGVFASDDITGSSGDWILEGSSQGVDSDSVKLVETTVTVLERSIGNLIAEPSVVVTSTANFTEGNANGVQVFDTVTITLGDAGFALEKATVSMTDARGNDSLTIDGFGTALAGDLRGNPLDPLNFTIINLSIIGGTGFIIRFQTVAGGTAGSVIEYADAIKKIRFFASGDNPGGGVRTANIVVTDSSGSITNEKSTEVDVTLTVEAINDPPTVVVPPTTITDPTNPDNPANVSIDVYEDHALLFTGANQLSVADVDAGNQDLRVTLTVVNGTLSLGSTANIDFVTVGAVGDGVADQTMTFFGSLTEINAALVNLSYTPDLNYNQNTNPANAYDQLTITVDDLGNSGTLDPVAGTTVTDTVAIKVVPVNDGPVITALPNTTIDEDAALIFNYVVTDADAAESNSADPLQVTLSSSYGQLTLATTAGLVFSTGDGSQDSVMTFVGTQAEINAALTGISFSAGTPNINSDVVNPATNNAFGNAFINVLVNDLGNTGARSNAGGQVLDALGNVTTDTTQAVTGAAAAKIATDSFEITIVAVNDPPTAVVPPTTIVDPADPNNVNNVSIDVFEDNRLVFSGVNQVTIADVDSDTLDVRVTLSAVNGTLTLGSVAGVDFTPVGAVGDGVADPTMTFFGTVAEVNAALVNLSYTPNSNYNQHSVVGNAYDTVTVVVNDLGNIGKSNVGLVPPADQEITQTIAIKVIPVNDGPSITTLPDTSIDEDTTLTFNYTIDDIDAAEAGVTDPLQVTLSSSYGHLTLATTTGLVFSVGDGGQDATMTFIGTKAEINTALTGIVFSAGVAHVNSDITNPATNNAFGDALINIIVNDLGNTGAKSDVNGNVLDAANNIITDTTQAVTGLAAAKTVTDSFQINIEAVNDPPVNDVPITRDGAGNVTNALEVREETQLVFSDIIANANAQTISITDVDSATGNLTVTLAVSNGTLNVNAVGGAIVPINNASVLTLTGTQAEINTTLATLSYTGNLNFYGADTLQIVTNDNGNTGKGPVGLDLDFIDIDVLPVNDAPILREATNTSDIVITDQVASKDTFVNFGTQIKVTDVDAVTLEALAQDTHPLRITLTLDSSNAALNATPIGHFALSTQGNTSINASAAELTAFATAFNLRIISYTGTSFVFEGVQADINAALSQVGYQAGTNVDTGKDANSIPDRITVLVDDGLNANTTVGAGTGNFGLDGVKADTHSFTMAVNDDPIIDLDDPTDPNNNDEDGVDDGNNQVTFTESPLGTPVQPVSIAPAADLTDNFQSGITNFTISTANFPDGNQEVVTIAGQSFPLGGDVVRTVTGPDSGKPLTVTYSVVTGTFDVSDPTGTPLSVADVQAVIRSITYQNNSTLPTVTGPDRTIGFQVTDQGGGVSATVTSTILVDALPYAANDVATTFVGGTVVSPSIFANDLSEGQRDLGNEPGSVSVNVAGVNTILGVAGLSFRTTAGNGLVTLDNNGDYTYVSDGAFLGKDSFTYLVTDADGDVSTAKVTIEVTPLFAPAKAPVSGVAPVVAAAPLGVSGAGTPGDAGGPKGATTTSTITDASVMGTGLGFGGSPTGTGG